ncbi:MAG: T9SS type A sorting domain-containing protein, partial [Candidatus Cloacimonetes bacterium]|nr:T9SS type A sorting domain-containing protein [Candidatus Cloacimonadota bacterium]
YGEIYENRTIRGEETWGLNKGGGGKAGYHSIETGYYAYLYGKLLLHGDPATLRYRFVSAELERNIRLTPIAIEEGELQIAQILHEGEPWTDFDPLERTLHIPAGNGGEFEVVFQRAGTGLPAPDGPSLPGAITLSAGQPNPFNPSTRLSFTLAHAGQARLCVYNLAGQRVATLLEGPTAAGSHELRFDAGHLPSGLYFVSLEALGQCRTRKLSLVR